jgi:hypothetical protein
VTRIHFGFDQLQGLALDMQGAVPELVADLPDGTLTLSGHWEMPCSTTFTVNVLWQPEDRPYAQAEADAMIGKPFSVAAEDEHGGFTLDGTITAATTTPEGPLHLVVEMM